ncbi:acyl-CoA dehydrogenase family protein [Nevskia sp.]|uniref:acyl-CoA dehydrogenase family protein n=1 Tax=Nevskia sp. TaxID=1929292 RepID=UPI00345815BB
MLPRTLFNSEHEEFRRTIRRFFLEEVIPHQERWEEQGYVPRELWKRAGELGFLCMGVPEEYGGLGADRLFAVVLMEEKAHTRATSTNFEVHSDIVGGYIQHFGTEAQKQQWLPKMATGEVVGALAMTEPSGGSDLQAIKTTAVKDGDDYLINGSKIFISNGWHGDIFVVAVQTETGIEGKRQISLLLVEGDRHGFTKGKPLKKIGLKGQDTCELFFENVRVPQSNLLGGVEGKGFKQLMQELAFERLTVAIQCVQAARSSLELTLDYTRSRKVFGKPVMDYQNSRFKLAEMKSEIAIAQVFVDRCIEQALQHQLTPEASATAKYWVSELYCRVVDECVQLHGGYGYMLEYPIARAYCDARASRIYLGANEIMKDIVARTL